MHALGHSAFWIHLVVPCRYCSPACQKSDRKWHKNWCHDPNTIHYRAIVSIDGPPDLNPSAMMKKGGPFPVVRGLWQAGDEAGTNSGGAKLRHLNGPGEAAPGQQPPNKRIVVEEGRLHKCSELTWMLAQSLKQGGQPFRPS